MKKILPFSFLVLALSQLPLAAEPSDQEKKDAKSIEQAYHEGAFDLCRARADRFLSSYPKSAFAPSMALWEAQAEYQSGHSDTALATLNAITPDPKDSNLPGLLLYWQGECLLDLQRWPDAEQKFRAYLSAPRAPGLADQVSLGLAWSLFKQNREGDATAQLQDLIKNQAETPSGRAARLLAAKIALLKGENGEAIKQLETLLADKPESAVLYEAAYWLGEAYTAIGKPESAVLAYQKVTTDPQAFPKALVAQAYLGLGQAEHALKQDDLAVPAYQQAYQLTDNSGVRLAAFQAYLETARTSSQLPNAVAKLQDYAKAHDSAAPDALFAIGSVLAEGGSDAQATGVLESLLVAYPKTVWRAGASEQLGLLYARNGRPDDAAKSFQASLAANPDPDLARHAHFQLGTLLYQKKDFAGASAQFEQVANGNDTLAQQAAYNDLLAQAGMAQPDAFAKLAGDFSKRFPQSTLAGAIALAQGDLLARLGKNDDAKAAYQKAISSGGKDPLQATLLQRLADLQYQTGDLEACIQTSQTIVNQFPDNSLAAAQRGLLASYELKKLSDDAFEQSLIALAQKYQKTPGAADVLFRLGEYYFYRQDYVKAQNTFQQLVSAYPDNPRIDQADFFAGQAAYNHQDNATALTLFDSVPDTSPFKPDARLWQARVYQVGLVNYDNALNFYNAVLATEKTGSRFVEANLGKGECYLALASKDASNYDHALDAFAQILNSKEGTVAERNEAAVSRGKILEKQGKTTDALGLYLDVLYGRVAGDDATSPTPPEFSFQVEAGWQAAHIREDQQDWRGAIEIYRRLEQIGGPKQQTFHDLINELRRDHYIYD